MATEVYSHPPSHSPLTTSHSTSQSGSLLTPATSGQWHIHDFHHRTKMLLTKADRRYLHTVLGDYQLNRQTDRLMKCLQALLDTPAKLDLLRDIRIFIPATHVAVYDALAPYHKMAHMWQPAGLIGLVGRTKKKKAAPAAPASLPNTAKTRNKVLFPESPALKETHAADLKVSTPADLKIVTLLRGHYEPLGFSIRGGSEHGLGIYISEVESGSAAEHCGLQLGDHILEVNSVSLESIASSSAVKVLTGSNRLKIVLRRLGKIPGFRSAREKTVWYDVEAGTVIEGKFETHGASHQPPGLRTGPLQGVLERRINLMSAQQGQYLGFNIRGGSEYGLGIFITRVDASGLAEQKGLKVGDQLVEVNGLSFEPISHANAVEYMRSHRQLMVTVRDVGKFPAYKEIFAEYKWTDATTGRISKTSAVHSVAVTPYSDAASDEADISHQAIRQFPRDTYVEAYSQTDDDFSEPGDDDIATHHHHHHPFAHSQPGLPQHIAVNTDSDIESDGENDSGDLFEIPAVKADSYLTSEEYETLLRQEYGEVVSSVEPMETSFPKLGRTDVLVPQQPTDVMLRQRPPSQELKVKGQGHGAKDRSPKSTIAVRVMELETRRKYPELALDLDLRENRAHNYIGTSKDDLDLAKVNKKSRTLREKFFGSKFKSATHGGQGKHKDRKPVFDISFTDNRQNAASESRSSKVTRSSKWREVEDQGHTVLNEDEVAAILRHLGRYEAEHNISSLLTPLLAILDTTDKLKLTDTIRPHIQEDDLLTFTRLVQQQQETLEAQEEKKRHRITRSKQEMKQRHSDNSQSSEALEKYKRLKRPSRGRLSSLDLQHQDVVEQLVVPGPPDAQHNLEILRPRSSSKVYKAIILPGTQQMAALGRRASQDAQLLLEGSSPSAERENLANTSKETMPEMEDAARPLQSQSTDRGETNGGIPVYSTVDKVWNMAKHPVKSEPQVEEIVQHSEHHSNGSHGNSADHGAVDSELSATESERQLSDSLHHGGPELSLLTTEATLGLFDDLLKDDDNNDDDDSAADTDSDATQDDEVFTAALHLHMSPTHSETTSLASTRFGSYEVNPSEHLSPVFFPPPPPESPPPPVSETGCDLDSDQGQERGCNHDNDPGTHDSDKDTEDEETLDGLLDWVADDAPSSPLNTFGSHHIFHRMNSTESAAAASMRFLTASTEGATAAHLPVTPRDESARLGVGDRALNVITLDNDTIQDSSVVSGATTGEKTKIQDTTAGFLRDPDVDSFFGSDAEAVTGAAKHSSLVLLPGGTESGTVGGDKSTMAVPPVGREGLVIPPGDSTRVRLEDAPSGEEEEYEEEEVGILRVRLDKSNKSLGISISGGRDSRTQPEVRIRDVFPNGAAAQEGSLQPGMRLLSVDGQSLEGASHAESVAMIRKSYGNKRQAHMDLMVLPVPRKTWEL